MTTISHDRGRQKSGAFVASTELQQLWRETIIGHRELRWRQLGLLNVLSGSTSRPDGVPSGWEVRGAAEPSGVSYDEPMCASLDGFMLHPAALAGVSDTVGREALLRYVLRTDFGKFRSEFRE
jgi:hypothetical protein